MKRFLFQNKNLLKRYGKSSLVEGVDYIKDKDFHVDPIELSKRISLQLQKSEEEGYELWRKQNKDLLKGKKSYQEIFEEEKKLYEEQIKQLEQEKKKSSAFEVEGFEKIKEDFLDKGDIHTYFPQFYLWFVSLSKTDRKKVLDFLLENGYQMLVKKIEVLFIKKMLIKADKNIQRESIDRLERVMAMNPSVDWELLNHNLYKDQLLLELSKYHEDYYNKTRKEGEDPYTFKEGPAPTDQYYVDQSGKFLEETKLISSFPDKAEYRFSKRYSVNAFPQFKDSDPKKTPRVKVDPTDPIYNLNLPGGDDLLNRLKESNEELHKFSDDLYEELNSLKQAAAGESNALGYGGGDKLDFIPPENDTGSLYPYDREYTLDEEFFQFQGDDPFYEEEEENLEDIEEFMEEDTSATFLDYTENPWEEILIFAKKTAVRTSEGRQFSDCCYLMVGNKAYGLIGVGYGMAASATNAKARARAEALRNLRSVLTTNGRIVQAKIEARHRKTKMILTPRRRGIKCHKLFRKIMVDYFKIRNFSLKIHGRKNPLKIIPLFFKLMDKIMTVEQITLIRGVYPLYASNGYADYLEKTRRSRGQFGWH